MFAWKFFAPGAVAPFTAVRWPEPDKWIEGADEGVHGCSLEDLPYWIDQELWAVELDGDVARRQRQLIGARGRLVVRIEGWPEEQPDFTAGCVERTRRSVGAALAAAGLRDDADRFEAVRDSDRERETALAIAAAGPEYVGYVADVIRRRPYPGTCAYMAANAAMILGGKAAHDDERAAQAGWFRDRLKLAPLR
jgi:hypothetical protein